MKYAIFTLFFLPFLSACSNHSADPLSQVEEKSPYIFTSVGYAPIEAQSGSSFDIKMLNAIKASKIEAYKEMAEQVYGVLLTAENSARGALLLKDNVEAKVKGLVRGARVLRSYHEGDVYITELELDIKTLPFLDVAEFNQQGVSIIKVEEAVYY